MAGGCAHGADFRPPKPSETATEGKADPHLRSIREVTGYHIHASDGEMGHVEDFIVDDAFWVIRYMVVHTGNWLPAKKVLISPQWLGEIRHWERKVDVTLTQEQILHCPEFCPDAPGIASMRKGSMIITVGRDTGKNRITWPKKMKDVNG